MAKPDLNVQLTPAQYRQLVQAEPDFANGHALLDRAERAGLDVSVARAELVRRDTIRRGLLAEFSPDQAAIKK